MRTAAAPVLLSACFVLAACGPRPEETAAAPAAPAARSEAEPERASAPQSAPAVTAASAPVLASGLFRNGEAQANVVEASRSDGILTVRARFVRTQGAGDRTYTVYNRLNDIDENIYLIAAGQKYFMLTDAEGDPLAPPELDLRVSRETPVAGVWWAKFPAAPPEVREFSLTMPNVEEIGPIPIADR